ncbi:MAG TPA: ATP-binding protein [Marinobacter sp.]|nr:ATP-binding protein [Marinobacter sp.]
MTSSSPLVNRLALAFGAIVLTALVSMATTLAVSRSIEGNATAINHMGALRMGAYQVLAELADVSDNSGSVDIARTLTDYEQRLNNPAIIRALPAEPDHPLQQSYQALLNHWQDTVKPVLTDRANLATPTFDAQASVQTYVAQVDELVSLLEQRTEARIWVLHLIQIISLAFSVIIALVLFLNLKNRILRPLRKLVHIARAVGEQDFSQKAHLSGADELATLGTAFDQMTSELALSYHKLEERVRAKTEELETSHAALEVMHSASRNLFANHDLCSGAIPLLQDIERLLGIGPIRLFLHDKSSAEPIEAVNTASLKRPFYCRDHNCNACLVAPEQYDELPLENNDGRRLLLPIRTPGQLLGTLEVWYPADTELPATTRRLLETLTDQLATAIFLERQITEEQQQTLAEERTVIARELHDSLAQSLSYLKIQVTRLRRLDIQGEQQSVHSGILDELSTGLNSAYRQLRELLATFRLKLDTPDLASALDRTMAEFSERHGKPLRLDYNLPPQTLSPNEEIHTLQIIREGLANAVKHADATDITVQVLFETPAVRVCIRDNGRGLPGGDQPANHYGLVIMQDRARTLGGDIRVDNHVEGGVEVTLTFVPKYRNLIATEPATA